MSTYEGPLDCHAHRCMLIFLLTTQRHWARAYGASGRHRLYEWIKCCTLKACNIWGGAGLLWQRWVGRTVGNRGFSSGAAGKPFLLSEQVCREMRRAPTQRRSRGCWWITIGMRSHHEPQVFPSHYQLLPLVSLIEAVLSGWLSPVVRCRDDCCRLGCATQDRGDLRRHRSCSPVRRDSAPRCPSHSQWVY